MRDPEDRLAGPFRNGVRVVQHRAAGLLLGDSLAYISITQSNVANKELALSSYSPKVECGNKNHRSTE